MLSAPWVCILRQPLTICATVSKSLNIFKPHLPLYNRTKSGSCSLLLWGFNEIMHLKYLVAYPAYKVSTE